MSIISELPVAEARTVRVEQPESTTADASGHDEGATQNVPLADVMLEPLVRETLLEDLGRAGDLTSNLIIPASATARLKLAAREAGVLAGMDLARLAFALMDERITFTPKLTDGVRLQPGDEIAIVEGPARAILSGERTAL